MKLVEVLDHVGGAEYHLADLGEHSGGGHQRAGSSEVGGHAVGEVERVGVVAPVERRDVGRRRPVVDVPVEVARPPGRVAQRPVADHLQAALDQRQLGVPLEYAVRLTQAVPRPVVVAKPLHRVLLQPAAQKGH